MSGSHQLHSPSPSFNQNRQRHSGRNLEGYQAWDSSSQVVLATCGDFGCAFRARLGPGRAASLPLAVSSGVVRDRLERDISTWAGHPVSLGDAPSLDFWPTPTIQLDNVEILPSAFAASDPIMRAESIVANFNLFSAVLGAPSFSEFRLIRPTFNVELYPDATSNWTSASGELARGIEAAVARDLAAQTGEEVPASAIIPAFCRTWHRHHRGRHHANGCGIRVQRPKNSQRSTGLWPGRRRRRWRGRTSQRSSAASR
jgi:hypothetical protein